MMVNRSVPSATIIPVLSYEDVGKASNWLCGAFGFTLRLRIGNHRAQLVFGEGAVILTERHTLSESDTPGEMSHTVHVRAENVDEHYTHAQRYGARIIQPPATIPTENDSTQPKILAVTSGRFRNRSPMSPPSRGAPRRVSTTSHKVSIYDSRDERMHTAWCKYVRHRVATHII